MSKMKAFLDEVSNLLPGKSMEYAMQVADSLLKKDRHIIKCLHCGDVLVNLHGLGTRWCNCQSVCILGIDGRYLRRNARFIFVNQVHELETTLVGPRDTRDDV